MFTTPDELLAYVKDNDVEFVDVRFCDLPGVMQHFTLTANAFDESVFANGLGFDGSSIRGFQQIHESDMELRPDVTTARLDPFRARKTLLLNFFIHDPLTGEQYTRDPRNVAKKAEAYLKGSGVADTAYFGPEAEFYIFDSVRYDTTSNSSYYYVDSVSGAWNTGTDEPGGNKGYKQRVKGGYFPVTPTDRYADLRDEMVIEIENAGMIIERAHHEVGSAGQAEINYKFNTLLAAADDLMLFKYIVKNVAWRNDKTVTFMPKPIFGDNGSGMHCHQSLWKDGAPLFYDEIGYAGLSDTARYYIGGLLKHAPSLLAFTNPTMNSYHRLVPGLRSTGESRLFAAQPLGLHPYPADRIEPEGEAHRVPLPRPVEQPVPRVLGDADGRSRRHQEQDRAADARRQGPLRAAAGRAGDRAAGSGRPRQGARPARDRPRVPARGRRLHARPDRDVDRIQAGQRDRPDPPASAPARIRDVLRHLGRRSHLTSAFIRRGQRRSTNCPHFGQVGAFNTAAAGPILD